MSRHFTIAKNLNIAVLVLSILGLVLGFATLIFGSVLFGSVDLDEYGVGIAGLGIAIFAGVYLVFYIFSVVCAGVIMSSINKGNAAGSPFVLAILNAVFSGLSGRYITMVLAILTAVQLNAARKDQLPNI